MSRGYYVSISAAALSPTHLFSLSPSRPPLSTHTRRHDNSSRSPNAAVISGPKNAVSRTWVSCVVSGRSDRGQ
jgi:hypothetical protein